MRFEVVTLFPQMFDPLSYGVVGKGRDKGLWDVNYWNPRDYATDLHKTVDDRPYGGGPGMVLKVEPLLTTINAAKASAAKSSDMPQVILLSPQGKRAKQSDMALLAQRKSVVLVSGRYEGLDERVIELAVDEQWSIGDYVLSGGELAAMVVMDATVRHIPGVLGHELSLEEDSFSCGMLDCPHYTRPVEVYRKRVPEVLLGGDHKKIAEWRKQQSLLRTKHRRSDLLVDRGD